VNEKKEGERERRKGDRTKRKRGMKKGEDKEIGTEGRDVRGQHAVRPTLAV